ncbi:SPOR domain-containing protein [bacterium]|nr:SPOR domain-containing protein [bacterium]
MVGWKTTHRPDGVHSTSATLLLILLLIVVTGCAGIRPAIQPPPPAPVVEQAPKDTTTQQNEAAEQLAPEPEIVPVVEVEPMETYEPEAPTPPPSDTLDFPSEALPLPPGGLAPVAFLPSAGPAPKGEAPPEIGEGWRVQVASVNDHQTAEEIERDVAGKTGEKVYTRYQSDRYTLLVGNFATEKAAVVLRDKVRTQGYEGAFVVKAPIVTSRQAEGHKSSDAAMETVEMDGWRVQVMSLGDRLDGERAVRRVSSTLTMPAYLEEVDGSFKVRVGNFKTRDEASQARKKMIDSGFEGAFPVQTRIILEVPASK